MLQRIERSTEKGQMIQTMTEDVMQVRQKHHPCSRLTLLSAHGVDSRVFRRCRLELDGGFRHPAARNRGFTSLGNLGHAQAGRVTLCLTDPQLSALVADVLNAAQAEREQERDREIAQVCWCILPTAISETFARSTSRLVKRSTKYAKIGRAHV